jgi:hypothetical protein
MALYGLFAHDGEHTFQENFDVPAGQDPAEAAARHLATAWGVDLTAFSRVSDYVDGLDEFSVEPATADQAVLSLIDAVAAHLASPRDDESLAALRLAHDAAAIHRGRYEPR